MVVKEAQRAFTYLSLYDYLTDLIVVNRELPEEVTDSYFAGWRKAQARYSEMVDSAFAPVPIKRAKLFDHEMVGLDNLHAMAESLFGDDDPAKIFHHTVPQKLKKVNGRYELSLNLPFASKDQIDITHRDGELFVTVGPYKREISLPRALSGATVNGARFDDGVLRVAFAERKPAAKR
jgi:arsenite-transporting ATPase